MLFTCFNKRLTPLFLTLLVSSYVIGQSEIDKKKQFKSTNFSIEIAASILPKAKIRTEEGNYQMKSHLQSSYDIGINIRHRFKADLLIFTGFHMIVGKRNFFAIIPAEDLPGYSPGYPDLYIEDKELWGSMRIPLLLEKGISFKNKSMLFVRTGINLRYSGLMPDLLIGGGGGIIDSNGQVVSIFSASFSGNNDHKPWITFLAGLGKEFELDNHNKLSVSLLADISTTYFYKGNYEITIPNKPITRGTYKINGTSLGLSVQYIFTGYNKRLVRGYEKKAF